MFRVAVRKSVLVVVSGFAAAAALALAPIAASAAPAVAASGTPAVAVAAGRTDVTPVGAVTVQLTAQGGAPRAVAGVIVTLEWGGAVLRTGTTNSKGNATIQNVQAKSGYTVLTEQRPPVGLDTFAPGHAYQINVNDGETTTVPIVIQHGASISGRVITPSGAGAGYDVYAFGQRTKQIVNVLADADGHYDLVGLATDLWQIAVYSGPTATPVGFYVDAAAQNGATPAQHLNEAPIYVHSAYDLEVLANGDATVSLNGASIHVWNPTTGAQGTTIADSSSDPDKTGSFELPSGTYDMSVTTVAKPGAPSVTYYYTGTDGQMTTNAALAGGHQVEFGSLEFMYGTVGG